jgi:archaeosine synthase beta-subunit
MSRLNRSSTYPETGRTEWILSQRPPRTVQDPFKPHGFFLEQERSEAGEILKTGTILLTNKECPWHCLMCDLWKTTLTQKVPPGAIPRQIEHALNAFGCEPRQLKLYNGGSFFDPAAIPCVDYPTIASRVSFAGNVVVESHPRLIGRNTWRFRDLLRGTLEVGMGLETVHPQILPRLNKNFTLEHFADATRQLRAGGVAVRAFILVKTPFMDEAEGIEWAVRSARFAFDCGANVVSLVPTRAGNGAMEQLQANGEFSPPELDSLEHAFEICLRLGAGRVFADTWNLELFSCCAACLPARRERLRQMNLTQEILPAVDCASCKTGTNL